MFIAYTLNIKVLVSIKRKEGTHEIQSCSLVTYICQNGRFTSSVKFIESNTSKARNWLYFNLSYLNFSGPDNESEINIYPSNPQFYGQ